MAAIVLRALTAAGFLLGGAQAGLRRGLRDNEKTSSDVVDVQASGHVTFNRKLSDLEGAKFISLDQSQSMFGGQPDDGTLCNWAEINCARDVIKHHPSTYEEVVRIVREVKAKGGRLRPLGTVLSYTALLPEDGTDVMFLDQFKMIRQDPNDYTKVTLQAGVTNAELADWADSPERGAGRFSYLPGNTLVAAATFVGASQTSSHGSGRTPPLPDFITAMTMVDSWGNIRIFDRSHPDFPVLASCLGMCGIVLDVTVKFDPSTAAVIETNNKVPLLELFPPEGTPFNDTYNPFKSLVMDHDAGAVGYVPWNSHLLNYGGIDRTKAYDLSTEGIWYMYSDNTKDTPVPGREGLPFWGVENEPYYDKDRIVVDQKFFINLGTIGLLVSAVMFQLAPEYTLRISKSFNCSHAAAQHYVHYLEDGKGVFDYSFTFKADDDFGNIYRAWWAMMRIQQYMLDVEALAPVNVFVGIRWIRNSCSPMSPAYGGPEDQFVVMEVSCNYGTEGWESFTQRLLDAWAQIRNKKDGSGPKLHWGKGNHKWTPGFTSHIKTSMAEQIPKVRDVVLKLDPKGLFRNRWLSEVFDMSF